MPPDHEARTVRAVVRALRTIPYYAKQGLEGRSQIDESTPLAEALSRLPLLTRERVRATLPKVWFPEGRDAKTELGSGAVSVVEAGPADTRVRVLFDAKAWRSDERRALETHPRAAATLASPSFKDAVLWVPERGTGSCGAGDPDYESRLEGPRLHLNSRQDPTFWTESVMTRMLDELSLHETTALLADPFYLDFLARHAAVLGRRLDVRGWIATTRARATKAQREALARVFAGPVIDLFAAREVGTLFVEHEDGRLHHAPRATHVELLPAKVETPGATDVAVVVVTTIEREVQPWVRYVLGDLVQIAPAAEGRSTSVPALASVEGSFDDAIVRPDGAVVTAGAIDRAVGGAARVYQVVQSEPDAVDVEIVGASAVDTVRDAIAPLLGSMRIRARAVTAIGVEPNGKYRTTRRRVPASLSAAFTACEGV
jgi:phenylacetate-CoA ligase